MSWRQQVPINLKLGGQALRREQSNHVLDNYHLLFQSVQKIGFEGFISLHPSAGEGSGTLWLLLPRASLNRLDLTSLSANTFSINCVL